MRLEQLRGLCLCDVELVDDEGDIGGIDLDVLLGGGGGSGGAAEGEHGLGDGFLVDVGRGGGVGRGVEGGEGGGGFAVFGGLGRGLV